MGIPQMLLRAKHVGGWHYFLGDSIRTANVVMVGNDRRFPACPVAAALTNGKETTCASWGTPYDLIMHAADNNTSRSYSAEETALFTRLRRMMEGWCK